MIMFWYVSMGMYLLLGSFAGFNLCFSLIYHSEHKAHLSERRPKSTTRLQFVIHVERELAVLFVLARMPKGDPADNWSIPGRKSAGI